METDAKRSLRIGSGVSGIAGVVLLVASFALAVAPPPNASRAELVAFGQRHGSSILLGAWLQAVGPVFIVLFAFGLVHLAGATDRLRGWMTFFGATVLMTVSIFEITCYISALFPDPELMTSISLRLIYAVQHLYFVIAAPALFLPLGIVLLNSTILPRPFGYLAVVLGLAFAVIGMAFMFTLILPTAVTACGGIQGLWWLAAAVTLVLGRGKAWNMAGEPAAAAG